MQGNMARPKLYERCLSSGESRDCSLELIRGSVLVDPWEGVAPYRMLLGSLLSCYLLSGFLVGVLVRVLEASLTCCYFPSLLFSPLCRLSRSTTIPDVSLPVTL